MPRFQCPSCRGAFEVAREDLGRDVQCPMCGVTLGTGTSAAPAAPVGQPDPSAPQWPQWQQGPQGQPGQPGQPGPQGQPMPPMLMYGPPAKGPNPAGAWSFFMALAVYAMYCGLLGVVIAKVDITSPSAQDQARQIVEGLPGWVQMMANLMFVLMLASAICGLYAVTRRGRRKALAVAGLTMSGLLLACACAGLLLQLAGLGRM